MADYIGHRNKYEIKEGSREHGEEVTVKIKYVFIAIILFPFLTPQKIAAGVEPSPFKCRLEKQGANVVNRLKSAIEKQAVTTEDDVEVASSLIDGISKADLCDLSKEKHDVSKSTLAVFDSTTGALFSSQDIHPDTVSQGLALLGTLAAQTIFRDSEFEDIRPLIVATTDLLAYISNSMLKTQPEFLGSEDVVRALEIMDRISDLAFHADTEREAFIHDIIIAIKKNAWILLSQVNDDTRVSVSEMLEIIDLMMYDLK